MPLLNRLGYEDFSTRRIWTAVPATVSSSRNKGSISDAVPDCRARRNLDCKRRQADVDIEQGRPRAVAARNQGWLYPCPTRVGYSFESGDKGTRRRVRRFPL